MRNVVYCDGIVEKLIREIEAKVFPSKQEGKEFMDKFLKKVGHIFSINLNCTTNIYFRLGLSEKATRVSRDWR